MGWGGGRHGMGRRRYVGWGGGETVVGVNKQKKAGWLPWLPLCWGGDALLGDLLE